MLEATHELNQARKHEREPGLRAPLPAGSDASRVPCPECMLEECGVLGQGERDVPITSQGWKGACMSLERGSMQSLRVLASTGWRTCCVGDNSRASSEAQS